MELSEERRASLLAYCQIQEPTAEDEVVLKSAYISAMGYLATAGIDEPEAGTPRRAQYDMLVNALVLDDFDIRGAQLYSGDSIKENPSFRRKLNQLKFTPVPNLGTGGE